jgi:hypothetical protein
MLDATPTPSTPRTLKVPDFDFKEIITAGIALAIVATLIVLLWRGFALGGGLGDNQKYILGIALSLAGTVTGYYFGRVPAEKRADTAERAENEAKDAKAKAEVKVSDARRTVERVLSGPAAFKTDLTPDPTGGTARQELEALRQRLS